MWPTLQRNGKRKNRTDDAVLRPRGRPKGTKDEGEPRWKKVPRWAQNTAEFAAVIAYLYKEKDTVTLRDIVAETGRSPQMCSYLLKRTGYKFHLKSYTFALSEKQKAFRKMMALDFEKAVFELPNFIEVSQFLTFSHQLHNSQRKRLGTIISMHIHVI